MVTLVAIFGIAASPGGVSSIAGKLRKMVQPETSNGSNRQFILQVQVQDAVKAEADRLMLWLRVGMADRGIRFVSLERTDPATPAEANGLRIVVKGVAAEDAEAFRQMIQHSF